MIVSIHQPDYIPYLGYFYKMSRSDVFVFLDDAQFSNDNMHHWNRIKTPQGECRLKVPVEQHLGDPICAVRTKEELKWKQKHLKTMQMNYAKSKHFHEIFPEFEAILLREYASLADMNIAINTWLAEKFGFRAKLLKSSELDIRTVREERVIDIVKQLGGDTYISGNGAKAYQVDTHFAARGVTLCYTDYTPIRYPQLWPKTGFLPYMSVMDFVFNCGFDWAYVEKAVEDMQHGDR